MGRIWLSFCVILIGAIGVVGVVFAEPTDQSKNLIKNGLFERMVTWDDVTVGENWAPWIISGTVKFGKNGHEPGQEIRSDHNAFIAGIYQEISGVKPGAQYYGYVGTASLYWGNTEGKFEEVGRTVGIDPSGGTDPRSPNIIWGNTTWSNKRWDWQDDPLGHAPKVRAIAKGTKITFFIKVEFHRGDNLAEAWLQDAAVMLDTEHPSGTPTAIPSVDKVVPPPPAGAAPVTPDTSLPPAQATPASPNPAPATVTGAADFAITQDGKQIGWFYTQTAKDGAGFAVTDQGQDSAGNVRRWWSEFTRLGGVSLLGYPISRPFRAVDGFWYQAFQRGILQWRPDTNTAVLANTLDWLSEAGKDDWARERALPKAIRDDGSGGDYSKAVTTRLSWLTEPEITKRYQQGPDIGRPWTQDDSIALYGLPSSKPEKIGPFIIQRFQRIAFQYWVDDAEGGPPKGSVVPVLAGDLVAQAGLIPTDALQPQTPNR